MRNLNSTGKQGSSLGLNDKSNPVPQLNAIRERGGEKKNNTQQNSNPQPQDLTTFMSAIKYHSIEILWRGDPRT